MHTFIVCKKRAIFLSYVCTIPFCIIREQLMKVTEKVLQTTSQLESSSSPIWSRFELVVRTVVVPRRIVHSVFADPPFFIRAARAIAQFFSATIIYSAYIIHHSFFVLLVRVGKKRKKFAQTKPSRRGKTRVGKTPVTRVADIRDLSP